MAPYTAFAATGLYALAMIYFYRFADSLKARDNSPHQLTYGDHPSMPESRAFHAADTATERQHDHA